ncbi:MAG: phoP [Chlamydiales bacterium]|jgi:DNA-binding response OmpR family regulator|nr:phoP [Chlamydiales bacterium]
MVEAVKQHIILIEDEEDIGELIKLHVEEAGYSITIAHSGEKGLAAVKENPPDLVLLDIMLPGIDGINICKLLKRDALYQHIPIIMLTAKSEEHDIIQGLDLGSKDYITKPFSPKVLVSRIKAVLRNDKPMFTESSRFIPFGPFRLDLKQRRVHKGTQEVNVTYCEFNILKRLLQNRGNVLSRDQLLSDMGDDSDYIIDRNIDVHIYAIRRKLGPNFQWIETVRNLGYRFKDL